MFGYSKEKKEENSEKERHTKVIQDAGYYISQEIVENTSLRNLHFAANTIKAKKLIEEEQSYNFDIMVDGKNFMRAESEHQKRVIYSYYLAQSFVDRVLNERTGVYVYENNENLEFHDSYPSYLKGFTHGLMVLRELEMITDGYNHSTEKKKFKPYTLELGAGLPNVTFNIKVHTTINYLSVIGLRYRGLMLITVFGEASEINGENYDFKNVFQSAIHQVFNHLELRNLPDLTEDTWEKFKNSIKSSEFRH